MKGAPLAAVSAVAYRNIRRTAGKNGGFFTVKIGFSCFMTIRVIKTQAVGVVDGDDTDVGKGIRQGIQLFYSGIVRITDFQHGDDLIHGSNIRSNGA